MVTAKHPLLRCSQHHSFFALDQVATQFAKPAKQSYTSEVVAAMGFVAAATRLASEVVAGIGLVVSAMHPLA